MERPINRPKQDKVMPEISPQDATSKNYNNEEEEWARLIEQDKQELEQIKNNPDNTIPLAQSEPKQNEPVKEESVNSNNTPPEQELDEIARLEKELADKKAKIQTHKERVVKLATDTGDRIRDTKQISDADELKKHAEIAEKNNVSNRVFTDIGTDEELADLVERIDQEDNRSDDAKEESPSPALTTLVFCDQIGQRTRQQHMMNRFVKELNEEKNQHFKELEEPGLKLSKVNPHLAKGEPGSTIRLKGESARIAVLSRTQGLYRIMLYNSGFWITIHTLSMADAAAFVHEVDADFQELGRIIGGQFHLVLGAYLKNKVLEILPRLIISSNLEGYDDPNILGEAISIHDYDTILWGICCSMYRDGIGIGVHCTNPDCRHSESNMYVDLTKACFINPDVFNEEAMLWMRDTRTIRTLEDCIRYRNVILNSVRDFELEPGTIFTLRVPSLQYFTSKSVELIGKMQAIIYKPHNQKNQDLKEQMTLHFYKMLAPWISKILYKSEDESLPNTLIDDYDAICTAMESLIGVSVPYYEKIEAYIRDTKCSMYTLTSLECPKCHKKPNLNSDGVFPLDVEYLFFGLSCRKLEQTGMTL